MSDCKSINLKDTADIPDIDNYDIRNLVVILIEGSGIFRCYNRELFMDFLKSSYEKNVVIQKSVLIEKET